jgi:hypothetical protein
MVRARVQLEKQTAPCTLTSRVESSRLGKGWSPFPSERKNSGSFFGRETVALCTRAPVQKHSGSTVSTTNDNYELTIHKTQTQ